MQKSLDFQYFKHLVCQNANNLYFTDFKYLLRAHLKFVWFLVCAETQHFVFLKNITNLLKDKEAGVIAVGHNWNGKESVKLEKEVLGFFGFKTPDVLSFNWQFLSDANDETQSGYKKEYKSFMKDFNFVETLKEGIKKFKDFFKL